MVKLEIMLERQPFKAYDWPTATPTLNPKHLDSQRNDFSNPAWFTPVVVVICIITAIKVSRLTLSWKSRILFSAGVMCILASYPWTKERSF